MIGLALNAVTSFSVMPLRLISVLGILVSLATLFLAVWILVKAFTHAQLVPGWASTVLPIYFLGGVQLIGIGVLGEYLGRMYDEVKQRPLYVVKRRTGAKQ